MHPELEKALKNDFAHTIIRPAPATHQFAIGEAVAFGNVEEVTVVDFTPNREVYLLNAVYHDGRAKTRSEKLVAQSWFNLRRPDARAKNEANGPLMRPDDLRYRTLASTIGGILLRIEKSGVDFEPEYQRGYEWTLEQKQELIATIFDRGSIGTVAFNRRNFSTKGHLYEVVDGKQRLSTLWEFVQDGFTHKGRRFSELHWRDQSDFENHQLTVYDLEDADMISIYRLFLRINRRGTPVNNAHIEKIEAALKALEAAKK